MAPQNYKILPVLPGRRSSQLRHKSGRFELITKKRQCVIDSVVIAAVL
jgi:hypothetical protein